MESINQAYIIVFKASIKAGFFSKFIGFFSQFLAWIDQRNACQNFFEVDAKQTSLLNCIPSLGIGEHPLSHKRQFINGYCQLVSGPRLKTQSCIKCLLGVREFYFLAIWAAGPVLKKGWGPIMNNFWGWFCHVFRVKNFWNHYSVRTKKFINTIFSKRN